MVVVGLLWVVVWVLWVVVGCCGLLWVVVGCCGLLWVVVGCCGLLSRVLLGRIIPWLRPEITRKSMELTAAASYWLP